MNKMGTESNLVDRPRFCCFCYSSVYLVSLLGFLPAIVAAVRNYASSIGETIQTGLLFARSVVGLSEISINRASKVAHLLTDPSEINLRENIHYIDHICNILEAEVAVAFERVVIDARVVTSCE